MPLIEILQVIVSVPLIALILLQNKAGGLWGEGGIKLAGSQRELRILTAFLVLVFIILGALNLFL